MNEHHHIIKFWFEDIEPKKHFEKDEEFDELLKEKFGALHSKAAACELSVWRETPEGALAEIIILDQFSRNIYRDTPAAFSSDPLALALAQEAIRRGQDQKLSIEKRTFLYMPFMHSESSVIHETTVKLFTQPGMEKTLDFEMRHKAIIDRFGRYPHRNTVLGRESTPEEIEFLKQPGSGF